MAGMKLNWKKTLKWGGISFGGVVLALGGWLGWLYVDSDQEYISGLENLMPADALVVTRVENFRSTFDDISQSVQQHFVSGSLRHLERSELWRELMADDQPRQVPRTLVAILEAEIRPALENASQQVENTPLGLDLYDDLIGKEVMVGIYSKGEETQPLILTRVSQKVRFFWKFKGFGEGQQGNINIRLEDDTVIIEGEHQTFITLLDDILVIGKDRELVGQVSSLHGGRSGDPSFADHQRFADVSQAIAFDDSGLGEIKLVANLDAVRNHIGPDKEDPKGRTAIDTIFSVPPSLLQASQEIMPTVNAALERAIDTRVFDLAGWSFKLGLSGRVEIDQYLYTDKRRLDDYPYLKQSWTLPRVDAEFLDYVPEDAWMVASVRQPYSVLRDAIDPASRPERNGVPDTVGSFMMTLGENPGIDGYGLVMLPARYAPLYPPPPLVSRLPWPPFAIFLRWPGVTLEQLETIMRKQLQVQKADRSMAIVRERAPTGDPYLAIQTAGEGEASKMVTEFAFAVVGDYFVFSYSRSRKAIGEILELAGGNSDREPLSESPSWNSIKANGIAATYINTEGLRRYNQQVGFATLIAEQKFDSTFPFDQDLGTWRSAFAKELGISPSSEDRRLEDRINLLKKEWAAKRPVYEAKLRGTIDDFARALEDMVAVTDASLERMHTKIVLREH